MYLIRSLPEPPMILVEMGATVPTEEALRAISQAAALASAGDIYGAVCDIRDVEQAPDALLPVAAALATAITPPRRLALVTTANQLSLMRRLTRVAGITTATAFFEDETQAREWLLRASRQVISPTALLHAEEARTTRETQQRRAARLATRVSAA